MNKSSELLDLIREHRLYDLAHSYFPGMPHFPTHPPFVFGLTRKHGDMMLEGGVSSSADSIALGSHVGTHIDALCHFSCDGILHGGVEAKDVQNDSSGFAKLGVETIAPILRHGVLLDIAAQMKLDALPTDFSITPEHLDQALITSRATIHEGDVVLLRNVADLSVADTAHVLGKKPGAVKTIHRRALAALASSVSDEAVR